MQDQRELMHRMWDKARKYDRLITWGKRHLEQFGLKRLLFWNFGAVNKRLKRYESERYLYCTLALGISRRLNAVRREQRKQRLDH